MTSEIGALQIQKTKLKQQYAQLIQTWQKGDVVFDVDNFMIATTLLKFNLLPEKAVMAYGEQVEKAMQESLQNKMPLANFFQKPNTQTPNNFSVDTLGQAVHQLVESGLSPQEAIQKISIQYKTSAFNVSKQYRKLFEPKSAG